MKKIVLISNNPLPLKNCLHQICEETSSEVEAIVIGKYYFGKEDLFVDYAFFSEENTKRLQEEFPNANVKQYEEKDFFEQANAYINKENILVLADVEYKEDWVFQFLQKSIHDFEVLQNVICLARYQNSVILCNSHFLGKMPILFPIKMISPGQWSFYDNDSDYLELKRNLTKTL